MGLHRGEIPGHPPASVTSWASVKKLLSTKTVHILGTSGHLSTAWLSYKAHIGFIFLPTSA